MLNKIILMGRLTREPELRYTPQNIAVCTITLAVDRDFARQGEQRETDFIDVVCWRQTAEFVAKWFHKGLLVACDGRLQSRKWKDKFEQNRVSFEVVADNVYFAERSGDAPRSGGGDYAPRSGGDYAPRSGGDYAPRSGGDYAPRSGGGDYGAPSQQYRQSAPAPQAPRAQAPRPDSGFTELDDDDDVPF